MKRVVLLSLALTGCATVSDSSLNPMNWFGSKTPEVKMAALPEFSSSVTIRPVWQASVGSSGGAIFSPAVVKGSVFAAAADGTVIRLDALTGKQIWRVSVGERLSGGIGSDGTLSVVGSARGEIIALDGDGNLIWKARVTSEVLAAPVVDGDSVIVRSADSRIFSLNAKDGKRRWIYQRATPALSVRSPAGVAVARGNVYAGFSGGKMVALAMNNGGVRWEATVSLPRGATELERVTDVVGLPYLSDREVCAVSYQGRVACFDATNGTVLWSREMSSTSGLAGDGRLLLVSDDKGAVHALDGNGGNSVWKQDKLFLRNLSSPLGLGLHIAVADIQGFVHLLSRDNGAFTGRVATDGSPISTNLAVLDRGFLAQTRSGGLFAFAIQ